MTSFSRFNPEHAEETCARCGGPLALRPVASFPVLLQAVFGVSFVAFLWFTQKGTLSREITWGWTALQVVLGVLLMRRRSLANRRVYRCLRCASPLR